MSRINETTDKYTTQTNTADGWAAQLAADRNNYQKGTHENLYGHDLAAAQSFVAHQFGQLEITGTQNGHLVGFDRNSKKYVSLLNGKEAAIGAANGEWQQTGTDHLAKFSADGSGLYQVGGQDRSGQDVAKSILKDRGMLGLNDGDPSDTQIANFQRDLLKANGRKVSDLDWFRHLKSGEVIKVPAGEQAVQADAQPPVTQSLYGQQPLDPQRQLEPQGQPQQQQQQQTPLESQTQEQGQTNPYGAIEPISEAPPLPYAATNPEYETQAKVDQQNKDLDAGYQYAAQLYGRTPITQTLIMAALKNTDLKPDELSGLQDIQKNFAKMGSYAPYNAQDVLTKDGVEKFKKQQEADTWFQAAKDSPELGTEMKNAVLAYKDFSKSSFFINGRQYLMKDDIPNMIKSTTNPQEIEGLKFLQHHYDDLVRGDENSGILQEEIDSWTKR